MTELNQIYKCNVCGNIVEVVHTGSGELVCCKLAMKLKQTQNEDEGVEKHKPLIEKNDNGVMVKVGSIPHPMESNHHIEWIEIITEQRVYRKHLEPGQAPVAEFPVDGENLVARAYCNLHELWQS